MSVPRCSLDGAYSPFPLFSVSVGALSSLLATSSKRQPSCPTRHFIHCALFRFLMMRNLSLIFGILLFALFCCSKISPHFTLLWRPKRQLSSLEPCLSLSLPPLWLGPFWCLPLGWATFCEGANFCFMSLGRATLPKSFLGQSVH